MKTKHLQWKRALRSTLVILLLSVVGMTNTFAVNHDFTSVAPNGQTLYYKITSSTEHTVMVTHPNDISSGSYWFNYYHSPYSNGEHYFFLKPTGNLIIPYYVQHNGISYSVTAIDDYAFGTTYSSSYACTGLTSVIIPSSVLTIGNTAFACCTGLTTITIPTSVISIGENVFYGCSNIVSVNFNATNCSSVGTGTWLGCSNFTTLNLGNMVTQIPENGFRGASRITSITIPNSVTSIGDHAFDGCTMLQSTFADQLLPNALESIGDYAFQNADSLSYIHIPNTVTSIGKYAFQGCAALNTVDFEATNCTYAGTEAEPPFFYCSTLATIMVGDNVTRIPAYCFKDCYSLTTLNLGNGLEEIETNGFFGCLSIDSLVIPASVDSIGSFAFGNWYELQLGYVESQNLIPPIIGGAMAFPTGQTIHVPATSLEDYESAQYWNEYFLVGFETTTTVEQTINLAADWNWFSTYLDIDLAQIKAALGSNGLRIAAQDGKFATYNANSGTWSGNLQGIELGKMYKIRTNEACSITLSGAMADPNEHPIILYPGNNWIGFISSESLSLDEAFGDFTPTDRDVIKASNGKATYYQGYGWQGSLSTLEPGKGYIYKSNATENRTLIISINTR